MLEIVPTATIREIVQSIDEVSSHDRDEMAIPSYLHANSLIRWLMWKRLETVLELAEIRPGDSVLDFGCGIGLMLPSLAKAGAKVYGVDVFPQFARRLVYKMNLPAEVMESLDGLADGSLDVILATDVLEHVDDPATLARVFKKKLKPGGRLILCGPTENFVYRIGRFVAGFSGKEHYHHTDVYRLFGDMTSAGFKADTERKLPFALPPHLFKIFRFQA